jgi:phosphoadenosine phosphosulfate reductase
MDQNNSHIAEITELDPALSLTHTLREAARHGERAVLLCSFQKEESVLLDELLRLNEEMNPSAPGNAVRIVTIDTGVLFPETLQTWRAFEERFGVKIEVRDASNPDQPWSGPEHCCSVAKVAALESSLAGAEGWITGIRREQGPTRAKTELIERDEGRGLWKYNPLAHWTDKDLWRRINERELPYNPLHDQGYESIGCAPCTQPGSGRDGRWAGTDKTECGLHVIEPAVN